MALATAAIQTAIRNVLDGVFDGVRDIAANTYSVGSPSESAAKALALTRPVYEIEITGSEPSEASDISNSSSRAIEVIALTITLTYAMPTVAEATARYTLQATMMNAANLAVQALTMPGNLDDDGAGTPVPTGIVSGLLTGPGGAGRPTISFDRDWDAQSARTTITASAVVVVTQPTS